MRRLFAILLLLAFGLPLMAQALALTGDPDVKLLACCRRNGAHHCAMRMGNSSPDAQAEQIEAPPMRCPAAPQAVSPSPHHDLAISGPALFSAQIESHPSTILQVEAWGRLALEGTRQKRGPPAQPLA